MHLPSLVINDKAAVRVERGHLWVFSNDVVSTADTAEHGGVVAIVNGKGEFLGSAFYNKHALIQARIYSKRGELFTDELLEQRIRESLARRERFLPGRRTCRLIFSEGDLLPGLIVDRYEDILAVQFLTLAMEQRRDTIVRLLKETLAPLAIVERSDVPARGYEGLPETKSVLFGELPESYTVSLNGIQMGVDVLNGQKTGLFLDQVDNWKMMEWLAPGKNVLDLFCHAGGFSLNAARAGAASVKAVDQSGDALSRLLFNAANNGLQDRIKAKESDAFQYVRARPGEFDVIVCDPPAFAKSRKQLEGALRGYREVNRHCLKMLTPHGVLVTCSCSAAVDEETFDRMLVLAAHDAGRAIRLLPGGGQPADHAPVLAMPETRYLKVRVVEAMD